MTKVALYARISTDDKGQDLDTQLFHLRKMAELHGYTIYNEYTDEASGRTVSGRKGYQQMMSDAGKHRFDMIMTYKLDRLHRNVREAISFMDQLNMMGISLNITSQNINTSTAMGRAMMQIVAVFAELESANTGERVKIGMERAKAQGKQCHAPEKKLSDYQLKKARAILESDPNISQRKLAEQFEGISRPTLIKGLRKRGSCERKIRRSLFATPLFSGRNIN